MEFSPSFFSQNLFFKDLIHLFLERGKGGRKRGREISVCERYIGQLPLACLQLGTWPTTKAHALTGNQTNDLLVHRPALNPLSHSSQGSSLRIFKAVFTLTPSHPASPWSLFPGLLPSHRIPDKIVHKMSAFLISLLPQECPHISFLSIKQVTPSIYNSNIQKDIEWEVWVLFSSSLPTESQCPGPLNTDSNGSQGPE